MKSVKRLEQFIRKWIQKNSEEPTLTTMAVSLGVLVLVIGLASFLIVLIDLTYGWEKIIESAGNVFAAIQTIIGPEDLPSTASVAIFRRTWWSDGR